MPALAPAGPIIRVAIQSGDEAAIRSFVERVLVAYKNNAAGDINALWSDKSPSIEPRKAALQKDIAAPGIRLSNLSVSKNHPEWQYLDRSRSRFDQSCGRQ